MAKKKFTVEITETLQRQIEVKANNEYEAEQTVRDMYRNEEIVLSSDDYVDTEFEVFDKPGQLEDIEEELGIDLKLLPTLLKIKKGDKIYVIDETLVEAEVTNNSLVNGELIIFSHYPNKGIMFTPVCYYSEYGKTWALTREELL